MVAVDAKRRADGSGWNVYKHGGRLDTGLDVLEWVKKDRLFRSRRDSSYQYGL